jgi:hypothetical protein
MRYLSEFIQRRGSHALSGRIGRDELRVCPLEVGQFSEQSIILPVGNLGVVLDIIEVVVMSDSAFELSESFLLGGCGLRRGWRVVIERILSHPALHE